MHRLPLAGSSVPGNLKIFLSTGDSSTDEPAIRPLAHPWHHELFPDVKRFLKAGKEFRVA
jgi:hypothetical protein